MKDLIALVPDKNVQFELAGLLSRYESLNIKQISYDIFVYPLHDAGVYHNAANFLRAFSNLYSYALVFIDKEGSGQEQTLVSNIASIVKKGIESNGWPDRVEVIVFDPELEIWVWTESPYTAAALGWDNYLDLKKWLNEQGFWEQNSSKPKRPKEAVEISLKLKRIPRSSSIYRDIALKVSVDECRDQSFGIFRNILQKWFFKG